MQKITLFLLSITLTGCSQYAETFDCGVGPGVGCKSLTYVNRHVEQGRLPYEEEEEGSKKGEKKEDPIDLNRREQRVWIASYRDEAGYVHEPSYVRMR